MSKPHEYRRWRDGIIRMMARAEGYVMVRRRGCAPFIISETEWANAPIEKSSG